MPTLRSHFEAVSYSRMIWDYTFLLFFIAIASDADRRREEKKKAQQRQQFLRSVPCGPRL